MVAWSRPGASNGRKVIQLFFEKKKKKIPVESTQVCIIYTHSWLAGFGFFARSVATGYVNEEN